MTSYKDILSSTVQSLSDKLREVSDKGGVKGLYDRGAERAKGYAQAARLSLAIKSEHEALNKVYAALGKQFFERHAAAPDESYAEGFSRAQELLARLQEKEAALAALREELAADGDEAATTLEDFEQVVQATEADGKGE